VGEEQPLPLITEFVTGYAQKGQLSASEIEILPDLINLRIFSNVIYFTGRCVQPGAGHGMCGVVRWVHWWRNAMHVRSCALHQQVCGQGVGWALNRGQICCVLCCVC
jgi:Ser/Thr protein kinase RdoA (MazF antagonist)